MMHNYGFTIRLSVLLLVLMLLAGVTKTGQSQDMPARIFSEQGELAMELNADWKAVLSTKDSDSRYPGRLTLHTPGGTLLVLDVEMHARGKSRRMCQFPPLKVYFVKEQVKGTTLRGNNSLKLVTHCSSSQSFSS